MLMRFVSRGLAEKAPPPFASRKGDGSHNIAIELHPCDEIGIILNYEEFALVQRQTGARPHVSRAIIGGIRSFGV